MGFEEPVRTATLVFEDEDYAGAEVVCRRNVSMGTYFEIARAGEVGNAEASEAAFRLFGERVLASWNVTVEGEPLPASGEGMLGLSPEFAALILSAWTRAVTDMPAPLGEPSVNGSSAKAPSIPMEVLSGSPGS